MAKAVFEGEVISILDDPDTSPGGQLSQIQRFDALIRRFDPDYPSEEPHPYIDHFIYEHDDGTAAAMGTRFFTPLMRACFREKHILAYHIYARSSFLDRFILDIIKPTSIRKYCDIYINIRSEIYQQVKILHEYIFNGNGAEVARLITSNPYLLNIPYGDGFTPLIAVCWALNLTKNDAQRRAYNQIARFLLSQPTLDILRYRVRSKSLKACYYCKDMDADVLAGIIERDKKCHNKPYAIEEEEPVGSAAAAPRGEVREPAPLPPRRPAGGAAVAANANANANDGDDDWDSIIGLMERSERGGRRKLRKTVKKSKQQKRRYRKSQRKGPRRHFL